MAGTTVLSTTNLKIYGNACRKSGALRKGGFHLMRYRFATHLPDAGVSVDSNGSKSFFGLASVKTTRIYTYGGREEIGKIRSPLASINL